MLSIVELTGKGVRARFLRLDMREHTVDQMWYEVVGTDFQFPIPLDEAKGATFEVEDKASVFRRWIRLWRDGLLANKPIIPTISSRGIGAVHSSSPPEGGPIYGGTGRVDKTRYK